MNKEWQSRIKTNQIWFNTDTEGLYLVLWTYNGNYVFTNQLGMFNMNDRFLMTSWHLIGDL